MASKGHNLQAYFKKNHSKKRRVFVKSKFIYIEGNDNLNLAGFAIIIVRRPSTQAFSSRLLDLTWCEMS